VHPGYMEENPSCDFVVFHHLGPPSNHASSSVLPEIDAKVSTSIEIIDEQGVDPKHRTGSRLGTNANPFSTPRPSDFGGIAVCWSDSVIQDDGIPDARTMFRVF
jgi:hypothetical protein